MRNSPRFLPLVMVLACTTDGAEEPAEDPVDVPALYDTGDVEETGCQPKFDRTFVMDTLEMLPMGDGLDLNGDGTPDNALGFLADAVNPGWVASLASGNAIFLWDLSVANPSPSADHSDVNLAFFRGFDADLPAEPKNNLKGEGTFVVPSGNFDIHCRPTFGFEHATLAGGTVTANTSRFEFLEPRLGTIELADYSVAFQLSEDPAHLEGTAGAIYTLCGLSTTFFPGPTPGTMLDFMVNAVAMQADIDRDGDGLERVSGDGTTVKHCIDGDGTIIEGLDCACDPRIADGFSVAFRGSAVPATIVGITDSE